MAKENKSSSKPKGKSSKGQIREGHRIGDNIKGWQPSKDRTGEPPKGTPKNDKK